MTVKPANRLEFKDREAAAETVEELKKIRTELDRIITEMEEDLRKLNLQ